MTEQVVVTIGGQIITIGGIASFIVHFAKKTSWFARAVEWATGYLGQVVAADTARRIVLRVIVAVVCVLLSEGTSFMTGNPFILESVWAQLLAYFVATATHDHLFKE